jgi:hypothetical protein
MHLANVLNIYVQYGLLRPIASANLSASSSFDPLAAAPLFALSVAVEAGKIAPRGHGNPELVDLPAECILHANHLADGPICTFLTFRSIRK